MTFDKSSSIIYVAGKYDDTNVMGVFRNINEGIQLCKDLFLRGYKPFCPWIDFHFILAMSPDELAITSKQHFLDYSLAFLQISKAMLVLPNWTESRGTQEEIAFANDLSIPVYYDKESFYREIIP